MGYIHHLNGPGQANSGSAPVSSSKANPQGERFVAVTDGFEPTIGLEVHAQLRTDSKMFCGCRAVYGDPANTHTCPVCLGLPGALPTLNKRAVELALQAITAFGGHINKTSVFARKNYFYPDLPKGYQISQYDRPIGEGGKIAASYGSGAERDVRLTRIHLEEDAGKLLHPEGGGSDSRVDLNRCGTPLIEIVSEPEIKSPEEASAYLGKLKQTLQYAEVCDGDMEKGQLRCDANVSVHRIGDSTLGTRTEIKNLNSFKAVERALAFEIDRQAGLLRAGREVTQATLLWDEKRQVALPMRTKEDSPDYRYFPEPDLTALEIPDDWIAAAESALPELPDRRRQRLIADYRLRRYDAINLTATRELADYFEAVMADFDDGQTAANMILTDLLGYLNEAGQTITECPIAAGEIAALLHQVRDQKISAASARALLADIAGTGKTVSVLLEEQELGLISDESTLAAAIDDVMRSHPAQVDQFRSGKSVVFGFLVGQVIHALDGRADPQLVNKLLKDRLNG